MFQRRKEALNEYSCLYFLGLPSAPDWFQICRFPDDPDFRISGFPYFRVSTFPVYVSTCIWPCRAGWIEGFLEVVALKSQFPDPKWDLPVNFLILEQTFTSERLFYRAIGLETWHSFTCFDLLSWDSKMAAYQQFLKHILLEFLWSPASQGLEYVSICESVPVMNQVSRTFDKICLR